MDTFPLFYFIAVITWEALVTMAAIILVLVSLVIVGAKVNAMIR